MNQSAATHTHIKLEMMRVKRISDPHERYQAIQAMSPRARAVWMATHCTAGEFREYLAQVDDADLELLLAPAVYSKVKTKLLAARIRRRDAGKI